MANHRHRPTEMFSQRQWGDVVLTNMAENWQVGALIFQYRFVITNRIVWDLYRPSVHLPPFLATGSLATP